jgi:hypothetical protein
MRTYENHIVLIKSNWGDNLIWKCNTHINLKSPNLNWFGVPKTSTYFYNPMWILHQTNGFVPHFEFMVVSWKHSPKMQYLHPFQLGLEGW